jgi:hypothetical protein
MFGQYYDDHSAGNRDGREDDDEEDKHPLGLPVHSM